MTMNLASFGFQGVAPQSQSIPSMNYGLFTQIQPTNGIIGTNNEEPLIIASNGVGTLSVPANTFKVGDSFRAIMNGHLTNDNNETLRIRIKANSIILCDTGLITLPTNTNEHFQLEINFTVRAIGVSGVAQIVSGGSFQFNKDASNNFEGVGFSTELTTGFNTTILNTLGITGQWGSANENNGIRSEIFTLNKTY
jgi:hypothetical protein